MWAFGAGGSPGANSGASSNQFGFGRAIVTNKGATDRDFNMPVCARWINGVICVLDSGNYYWGFIY